jgi:recombination protein RecA
MYGEGISKEGEIIDLGVNAGVVEKSGAWFAFDGERIGQGRENTRTFLKDNKDIFIKMDGELRKKLGIGAVAKADVPEVPAGGTTEAKEAVRPRRG